jgi:hypothetical protein
MPRSIRSSTVSLGKTNLHRCWFRVSWFHSAQGPLPHRRPHGIATAGVGPVCGCGNAESLLPFRSSGAIIQPIVLALFSDMESPKMVEGSVCIVSRMVAIRAANDRIYWQRNRLTPAEPFQHHAHTLTCRHAGEFRSGHVVGEVVLEGRPRGFDGLQ